jgi:hypothetical protein
MATKTTRRSFRMVLDLRSHYPGRRRWRRISTAPTGAGQVAGGIQPSTPGRESPAPASLSGKGAGMMRQWLIFSVLAAVLVAFGVAGRGQAASSKGGDTDKGERE